LQQGLEHHPSSYELLRDFVRCLSETGKHQDVISLCKDISVVQMEFETDIWNYLGYAYWKTGDFENAEKTYEKALDIDDENPALLSNFGNIYLSAYPKTKDPNQLKRTIQLFEKSIALDPTDAQTHYGLGMAYLGSRDMDRAMFQWEKALDIEPGFILAIFNLGRAHLEKGDKVKALDYFMRLKNDFSDRVPAALKPRVEDFIMRCKE
jgi:tetratricopeptide (TPR) repeat protein